MYEMMRVIFLVLCFQIAAFTDPSAPCVIELGCAECVPDNMPLVTSHRAANGSVAAAAGDEVLLSCGAGGKFVLYPLRGALAAACEGGRYRVRHDGALRHLLDLGCQENVFEDVEHSVEYCGPPLQGRAYQFQEASATVHLATACFDEDRGVAAWLHASSARRLPLAPHPHQRSPLSLLGNFNHMFDASTRHAAHALYSDDERATRRLRELFKHDRVTFARQTLTAGKLLADLYFDDQYTRVTDFVSNKVSVWASVAEGNLRHLHRDVAEALKAFRPHGRPLDVYAGTHGTLALRTGATRTDAYLRAGRRFPVPRYLWTVVYDGRQRAGVALVLLNDPFVAVSEIKDAVFCESRCGRVQWLHELRRNRNYEVPLYGLVFCCALQNFTDVITEMPRGAVGDLEPGDEGLLTTLTLT